MPWKGSDPFGVRRTAWRVGIAAAALGFVVVSGTLYAQERASALFAGQALGDALKELERRGLRIIYSSEAVRPDMSVTAEPRATSPRRMLDELLRPHGLLARDGPAGSLLVVKDPRARSKRSTPPETRLLAPAPSANAPTVDAAAARFEETITVTDIDPRIAPAGPPPLGLRPQDVGNLAGGFENVFRTLQAMPGVTAAEELGSRISVRGGDPDENLTIMDGIEIHNPYRLFVPTEDLGVVGWASMFNAETVDGVALYPGAFDVQYGDRLSSLLVVRSRDGSDAEAFQGFASFSLTDANVIAEGKLPDRVRGSWLLTARRTHLDLLVEPAIGVALPSLQDVQAKLSWLPRPGQRLSMVGMAGRERISGSDRAEVDERLSTSNRNGLLAVTFESTLGSMASSRTIASFSSFSDSLARSERSLDNSRGANTAESLATGGLFESRLAREIGVQDLALRQEFVFKPSARHWLEAGAESHRLDTRWTWTIAGARSQHQANGSSVLLGRSLPANLESERDSYRLGAWAQDRFRVSTRVVVQPGVRVDRSSLTGQTTLSPRLGMTAGLGDGLRFDAAVRLHTQSPGYEKLLQSDYFIDLSDAQSSTLKAERALHLVAGVQKSLGAGLSARVDGYYKRLTDLVVGRLETEEERRSRLASYDVPATLWSGVPVGAEITTVPVNAGQGRAYGVDTRIRYGGSGSWAALSGWAGYSFGRATRTAYGVTYPADYDRRHSASLAAAVRIGPRVDLSLVGRWATGRPRTPVRGVRLALVPDDNDADGDGNLWEQVPQRDASSHPLFQPDLGDLSNLNTARLPPFARVDVRLTYRPSWSGDRWALYADFLNVFNATNVVQFDSALVLNPSSDRPGIIERAEDHGLRFFPSFGVRVWF